SGRLCNGDSRTGSCVGGTERRGNGGDSRAVAVVSPPTARGGLDLTPFHCSHLVSASALLVWDVCSLPPLEDSERSGEVAIEVRREGAGRRLYHPRPPPA